MGYLDDPKLTKLLFGCLIDKLGGEVTITQADIDRIAYTRLEERGNNIAGWVKFKLVMPNAN